MKTRATLFYAVVLVGTFPVRATSAWSQSESVHGSYDAKNNWIVFEWENHEGKQKATLDSSSEKIKPLIHADVSIDEESNAFTYSYQITNRPGAVQLLNDISVMHSAAVFDVTSATPQSEWHSTEFAGKNAWSWVKTKGAIKGIPPGQTAGGFSFKSRGVPKIVNAWFSGRRRIKFVGPSPDVDSADVSTSFERVYKMLQTQYPKKFTDVVEQKSVGPIDPPAVFVATDFIQNMLSLEAQAVNLGWIKTQGFSRSLETKLDHAKKEITSCKIKTAVNNVRAFLNEVREAGDKNITSEGYALMYFNGRYLLKRLESGANLNCPPDRDSDDSAKS